ncbi:hypothetical protein B0H14DRAFT_3523596, partial [Mycena olivaceomarginata]
MAKRWWSPSLTRLRTVMRRSRRTYQSTRVPSARADWLVARRNFYGAIASAKREILAVYLRELEPIRDPETGSMIISHHERGRALGRACLVTKLWKLMMLRYLCPRIGARTERGGSIRRLCSSWTSALGGQARVFACPPVTSEAPHVVPDPIALAESIDIADEREFVPVTDAEVDSVIMSSAPWKAPDSAGIQMGHIQRGYSVTREWIRPIFKASVELGTKPTPLKSNLANPTHKAGKKDKTSTKACDQRNVKHMLGKALDRLIRDRVSYDAEALGFLDEAQHGGPPATALNKRLTATSIGARIIAFPTRSLFGKAALGYSRPTYAGSPPTFMCTEEGAAQGSALSVIVFGLGINRLLRLLKTVNVSLSWRYGFVDDTNFSTASKIPIPERHRTKQGGRAGHVSDHYITFDGEHIYPSDSVKWLGVWLDPKLNGELHIKKRAGSAARALNAAMALTHESWGLNLS